MFLRPVLLLRYIKEIQNQIREIVYERLKLIRYADEAAIFGNADENLINRDWQKNLQFVNNQRKNFLNHIRWE